MVMWIAVIKMNAMVEDYATALNRKSILNVRLKGVTGEDNFKVAPPACTLLASNCFKLVFLYSKTSLCVLNQIALSSGAATL